MLLEEDGPAETGGLWVEDDRDRVAGQPVASVDDLHRLLTQLPVGERSRSVSAARRAGGVARAVPPETK